MEVIGVLSGDGIETITRHILCCSSPTKTAAAANDANLEEQISLTNNQAAEEYAPGGTIDPTVGMVRRIRKH